MASKPKASRLERKLNRAGFHIVTMPEPEVKTPARGRPAKYSISQSPEPEVKMPAPEPVWVPPEPDPNAYELYASGLGIEASADKKLEVAKPARNFSWRKWLYIGLGAGLIALGFAFAYLWSISQQNIIFAIMFLGSCGGGVVIIWLQIFTDSKGGAGSVVVGVIKPTGPVNSLNIYAKKDETGTLIAEKIAFEWLPPGKLLGQPQECLNNHKWYHVHIWDVEKGTFKPFALPDCRYTDPAKLARYLNLPAQRRYLRHRESLMKLIGPALLALLVGIGFFIILAMG